MPLHCEIRDILSERLCDDPHLPAFILKKETLERMWTYLKPFTLFLHHVFHFPLVLILLSPPEPMHSHIDLYLIIHSQTRRTGYSWLPADCMATPLFRLLCFRSFLFFFLRLFRSLCSRFASVSPGSWENVAADLHCVFFSFRKSPPAHYTLKYNLMPYVGALTYGEIARTTEPVPFPESRDLS